MQQGDACSMQRLYTKAEIRKNMQELLPLCFMVAKDQKTKTEISKVLFWGLEMILNMLSKSVLFYPEENWAQKVIEFSKVMNL